MIYEEFIGLKLEIEKEYKQSEIRLTKLEQAFINPSYRKMLFLDSTGKEVDEAKASNSKLKERLNKINSLSPEFESLPNYYSIPGLSGDNAGRKERVKEWGKKFYPNAKKQKEA